MRFTLPAAISLLLVGCAHSGRSTDPGPSAPVVEYLRTQETLTPLPLRVSLPRSSGAEHVVVLFRTWGSRGWKQIDLARSGQTWRGEISCREVSTVTGDTKYFFLTLDHDGDIVGGSGSPSWPHVATIVGALPDGPQSLPGGSIPMRCHDPADCPPDFPGCPAYAIQRRACASDGDCADGSRCAWDGYCGAPSDESRAEVGRPVTPAAPDEDADADLDAAIRAVTKRYKKVANASR